MCTYLMDTFTHIDKQNDQYIQKINHTQPIHQKVQSDGIDYYLNRTLEPFIHKTLKIIWCKLKEVYMKNN